MALTRLHQQAGMALIDVLIAMIVIGVGITALAKLQAFLLRSDATAQTMAVAAQLAREKLDDLRGFSQLQAGAAGVYGFDEIGNDSGGGEAMDGSLLLAAQTFADGDNTYTRSWTSAARSWCNAASASAAGSCSGATRADFVQVRVSIAWTDASGDARVLALESAIAAVDPQLAATGLLTRPNLLPPIAQPP